MVRELRGHGPVLGPVAGVVRAHRQFVDEDAAVAGLEEFHREVPDDTELLRDAEGQLFGAQGEALVEAGGGRDHRVAHAVDLPGLDDGVGHGLAVRGADDIGRELPYEVDLLLREDGDAGLEGLGRVLQGPYEPHPFPS